MGEGMWESRVVYAAETEAGGGTPATASSAEQTAAVPQTPTVEATTTDPKPTTAETKPITPAPREPDWRDRRIAELTHKLNEARRVPAAVAVAPQAASPPATGETQEAIDARVNLEAQRRAEAIAAQNDWNRQCNDVAAAGKAEFQDFDAKLAACQSVVNKNDRDEVQQFNEFLHAAIEAGQAHKLIHSLGENPGEVKRLMGLSGAKRVVELTRMADKLGTAAPVADPSGAPKPITPLGSKGLHYDGIKPDDKDNGTTLPIREWMKQREKQVQGNRERGVEMQ